MAGFIKVMVPTGTKSRDIPFIEVGNDESATLQDLLGLAGMVWSDAKPEHVKVSSGDGASVRLTRITEQKTTELIENHSSVRDFFSNDRLASIGVKGNVAARIRNALLNNGIGTVADLQQKDAVAFLKSLRKSVSGQNFGSKSCDAAIQLLKQERLI